MIIEYAKRIKKMIDREVSLEQQEKSLVKAHFQYSKKLEELELRYQEQNEKFSEIRKRLDKEREMNEKREQLLVEGKALMSEIETTAKQRIAEAVYKRQQKDHQLAEIHNLKLATNTYVNLKALPERIQGVAIIETEGKRIWRPFCVESINHSPEELKRIIWGDSEIADEYSKAWEEILFRPLREMLKQ